MNSSSGDRRAAERHQFLYSLVLALVLADWLGRDRLVCVFLGGCADLPNRSTAAF